LTSPAFRFISQPYSEESLGSVLLAGLSSEKWDTFLASIAFVKRSGTTHIKAKLHTFAKNGTVRISVGVDHGGTSLEGVEDLWGALNGNGELFLVHHVRPKGDRVHHSFHPKVYLFRNDSEALLVVGSGNLTQGGLFGNYEAALCAELDLANAEHRELADSTIRVLDLWANVKWPQCVLATPQTILRAFSEGHLPREATIRARQATSLPTSGSGPPGGSQGPTFAPAPVPPPPPPPEPSPVFVAPVSSTLEPLKPTPKKKSVQAPTSTSTSTSTSPTPEPEPNHSVLYIEVIPHHNGEVFLSKSAIKDDPGFFGHPFEGETIPRRANTAPYPMRVPDPIVNITVFDDGDVPTHSVTGHPLNMVEYSRKAEIRITLVERMQDEIPEMSLLVMKRLDPTAGAEYSLEFYPPGSPTYGSLSSELTESMPSGGRGFGRRYGWS
jgi:HKD family nuclease